MKTLLIGLGSMGLNHLRILKLLIKKEDILVFDKNKTKLKKNLKKLSKNQNLNLNNLIKSADNIIIATNTLSHFNLIKKCIEFKKKKIFVEKPYVNDISKAKIINQLLKKNKIRIFVGLIERFNSNVLSLRNYIKNQKILSIDFNRTARVNRRNQDIDVVSDLMIHDIDLAIQFNGEIKLITATGLIKNKIIQHATVNLTHKNNSLSSLSASRMTDKKMRNIDVLLKNSFISANLLENEISVYKQAKYSQKINKPYNISSRLEKIQSNPSEPLLLELEYFLKYFEGKNTLYSKSFSQEYNLGLLKICKNISNKILKFGINIK